MRSFILLVLLLLPIIPIASARTVWMLRVNQIHGSPIPISVTLSYKVKTCTGKIIEQSNSITLRRGWLRVSVTPNTVQYRARVCLSSIGEVNHWELNGRIIEGRCVEIEVARDGKIVTEDSTITIYLKGESGRSESSVPVSPLAGSKSGSNALASVTVTQEGNGWVSMKGRFLYRAGSPIVIEARDNLSSGDIFYTWEVNNVTLSYNPLRLLANGSMKIVAVFRKVTELSNGSDIDVWGNVDLIAKAVHSGFDGKMVLGGPAVNRFNWESLGIKFVKDGTYDRVSVGGKMFKITYGKLDYGFIYLDGKVLRAAGVTRYGTRAALLWFASHPSYSYTKVVGVLWRDLNGDEIVEPDEIGLLHP